MNDPLGQYAAHPDLRGAIAQHYATKFQRASQDIVTAEQVRVLQQRTFYDRQTLWGRKQSESACLAVLNLPDTDHTVLFLAARPEGESAWRMAQTTSRLLGRPPVKPFAATTLYGGGRLIMGATVSVPEMSTLRITLADGTILEDTVNNNGLLLFVPLHSPKQWEQVATIQLLDKRGGEIESGKQWVHPYQDPPPASGAQT